MKEFVAQGADGRVVRYVDRKRYLWLLSLTGPLIPILSIYWYLAAEPNGLKLLIPLAYMFFVVPMLDAVLGEDPHNPPNAVVPMMADDWYYRAVVYAALILMYVEFFVVAWFLGTQEPRWWTFLGLTLGAGIFNAGAIVIGHELGHKNSWLDRHAGQLSIAIIGYGHFCIEHNRGHHVHVSTPEDCASARMGESVYKFMRREIPGGLRRGWANERQRLAQRGHAIWSWRNEILQSWTITLTIAAVLIALFGWIMVPFLLIHHFYGWFGLTQANYVEHYGLLRAKLPNGRYEPCALRHSWNTNYIFSNLSSLHLQRHSDHHANPLRPFQALRDFNDLPRLPSGYPGCFGMLIVPSMWFNVMDPKVVEWAGGDLSKVNIDPVRKEALYRKYGAPRHESVLAARDA